MSRVSVGDIQLNVLVDGSGPPVLLLHGFTGSARTWDPFVTDFAAHFTVYRVDLPGHGLSDSPTDAARYRVEACVNGILSVCDRLGLDQIDLLGYSMGGRVALRLALDAPRRVRHLVLESASPGIEAEGERWARAQSDSALASLLETMGLEPFLDHWERLPVFRSQAALPPPVRETLRQQRLENSPLGLANSLRGLGPGVTESQWHRLPSLIVPTLVIVGALDEKYRAMGERMRRLLPRCQLGVIPQAGHAAHLEQPGPFLDAVTSFLLRDDAATARNYSVPEPLGQATH